MTAPVAPAATAAKQEEVVRDLPVTPMMRTTTEHPFEREAAQSLMPSERDLEQMMKIADKLAQSGFLPMRLNTPGKVLATIMTGRELGLPPMLSTRSIRIMKDTGLPIISADVLLGAFKRMGGRAIFTTLTDTQAVLELRHPNGDTHTESFTIGDARRAGLLDKRGADDGNNWQKYPKAMLRSRCITAGLKSVGWEPAAGMYDADEAEEIAAANGSAQTIRATVSAEGQVEPTDVDPPEQQAPIYMIRGVPIDAMTEDGHFKLSEKAIRASIKWAGGEIEQSKDTAQIDRMERFIAACEGEIKRREAIETKFAETKADNLKGLENDTRGIAQGGDAALP
jgi:hypothetical protein